MDEKRCFTRACEKSANLSFCGQCGAPLSCDICYGNATAAKEASSARSPAGVIYQATLPDAVLVLSA